MSRESGKSGIAAGEGEVPGDAAASEMVEDATAGEVAGDATAGEVAGDATAGEVVGDATASEMVEDATAGEVPGDAAAGGPGAVAARKPGDVAAQKPDDVAARKPGAVAARKPGAVAARKPGDVTAPDPGIDLFGVRFQSPVLLASGTCGYGREYADLIPLDEIGGLVTKAVSVEPRAGNPPHRVSETPGGMINAIGLENPGLDAVIAEKLPWLAANLRRAHVFVNVVGRSEDEFARVVAGLDGEEGFLGFEINVSCPNVKGGTMFGTDEGSLAGLVQRLRQETGRPLVIKLTPNVPDVGVFARICEQEGADGLSAINTFPGMLIDVERRRPVIGNLSGGVSGPAILPMGVYATWRAAQASSLPIMGVGGIRSGSDAIQYLLAGASLVQVGTASFVDPHAAVIVQEGIREYMVRRGVENLGELVGALEVPARPEPPTGAPEDEPVEA